MSSKRYAIGMLSAAMLYLGSAACTPQANTQTILSGQKPLPSLEPIATQSPVANGTEAFAEIQGLEQAYQAEIGVQSGWLHLETRHTSDSSIDRGSLPNGAKIPTDYRMVSWYYLDESGVVVKAHTEMVDEAGSVVQESVFLDGRTTNVTLNHVFATAPYRVDFTGGIENDLSNPAVIVVRSEPAPGQVLFEISVPGNGIASGVSTESVRKTRSLFDTLSGALLSTETIFVAPDGNEQVFERMEVTVSERVETPPAEVMKALSP